MTAKQKDQHLLDFGRKIKEIRLLRKMSQEDLADRARVHRTYVGMIERGEKNITLITMNRMAEALGVSVNELIKDRENG